MSGLNTAYILIEFYNSIEQIKNVALFREQGQMAPIELARHD